jgi:hypothetical protein
MRGSKGQISLEKTIWAMVTLAFMTLLSCGGASESLNRELLDAVSRGELHRVKELLGKGANPNCRDENGFTPLMFVCSVVRLDGEKTLRVSMADMDMRIRTAALLLAKGAAVNSKNKAGKSPLILAATEGSGGIGLNVAPLGTSQAEMVVSGAPGLVKLLLEKGADCKAKDADGKTALDLAKQRKSHGGWTIVSGGGSKGVVELLTPCSQRSWLAEMLGEDLSGFLGIKW